MTEVLCGFTQFLQKNEGTLPWIGPQSFPVHYLHNCFLQHQLEFIAHMFVSFNININSSLIIQRIKVWAADSKILDFESFESQRCEVSHKFTFVSEDRIASIFRVEQYAKKTNPSKTHNIPLFILKTNWHIIG
jgi:hypothetical protein